MSFRHWRLVIDLDLDLTTSEFVILLLLADCADAKTDECWPGIRYLERKSHLRERRIYDIIPQLTTKDLVEVLARSKRGQPTRYRLTLDQKNRPSGAYDLQPLHPNEPNDLQSLHPNEHNDLQSLHPNEHNDLQSLHPNKTDDLQSLHPNKTDDLQFLTQWPAISATGRNNDARVLDPVLDPEEKERSRSDSECRTREAQIESASSVQTELDTDRDAPQPETSDFLILNSGKDVEPANDEPANDNPADDVPMFVCGDMDAWLQPPDDDALPAEEPGQIAESCLHLGDEDRRYFRPLPDQSFQCLRCDQTVWDEAARPRARDAPKRVPKERRQQCQRPFEPSPIVELATEDFLHACPKHGRLYIVLDDQRVELCQRCGWQPEPGEPLPPEWTRKNGECRA